MGVNKSVLTSAAKQPHLRAVKKGIQKQSNRRMQQQSHQRQESTVYSATSRSDVEKTLLCPEVCQNAQACKGLYTHSLKPPLHFIPRARVSFFAACQMARLNAKLRSQEATAPWR